MKNKKNTLIIIAFLFAVISSALLALNVPFSVIKQGEVQYETVVTTGSIPAEVGQCIWKQSLLVEVTGAPVFFGNKTFFASKTGYIYCSNPEDGHLLWKKQLHEPILKAIAIDKKGRIFAATSAKKLYCLDMKGEIKWNVALEGIPRTAPIMTADHVYVGTEEGLVYAVNKTTHKIQWKTDIQLPIFSSAVFNHTKSHLLIPTKNYYLVAVDTDGNITWKFDAKGVIYSSPAVTKTGEIYLTSMNHHIYKLSPQGTLLWKFKCDKWIISSPIIDENGNVYFGSYDKHFYCLDSTGRLIWKYRGKADFNASPAIDSEGNIYAGDSSGTIYAFNPQGNVLWTYKTPDVVNSSFSIYSPSKILLIGGMDSLLYAFKISGRLSGTAVWPKFLGNTRNNGYSE